MKRHNTIHFASQARSIALACGLAIALAVPAWSAPASDTRYPKVLHDMIAAGKLQVVKTFATDKDGMTGYIVKRDGYQTVVYSERGYLMLGPLYGPQGQNLSQRYARKYTPHPAVAKTINSLDTAHLITQGPANAPTLYIFADPNCIFCHELYQQVEPLVKTGRLRIHWIMVGVLDPSSAGRAAAILTANNPLAALQKNETHFDVNREQGGIAPVSDPSNRIAHVLAYHRQAMFSVDGTGTPTLLYINAQKNWTARVGMPSAQWLRAYTNRSGSDNSGQ